MHTQAKRTLKERAERLIALRNEHRQIAKKEGWQVPAKLSRKKARKMVIDADSTPSFSPFFPLSK